MTALTLLQSRPATAHPVMDTGQVRQCYERLLHGPDNDDKQAVAHAFLQQCIGQAKALPQETPDDPQALQAWVEAHSAGVARQYADYLERRKSGGPREFFGSKAHALYFLQAVAPTKLVDGAWLYGVLKHWHDHRFDGLVCTYLEELGDGHPAQNHVVIYRKLLAEHGLVDAPDIDDERYLQGAVQLALGYAGDEYLPEVIGYNLGYEQLPLHLLISAYELTELDIDPYYFTLHVTIDNASTGHAQKAVQALMQLMPMEADRESFWQRVSLGYRLNDLGQGSRAIIESFDLYREVLEMLERKRPFGQHMHSDYCKFEGKTVNQWLSAPGQLEGFLEAMQNKGWIKRHQDPQDSRFWTLIEGAGAAMFGVFSPYEKQLLHDWIAGDWLKDSARSSPRRSQGATSEPQTPVEDPDVQNLQRTLRSQSPDEQLQTLMPWLSARCHSHPAGLLATRRFIELKSAVR
ncbi:MULTISPECIES: iron-containing redox enzyme family protein [Pseudomonas]|uniref:iron-containing redox enzyme family protein n=1 Tax=Pseudomonas TaxID=286 RepID=UPI001BE991FF|nr:MULTISPECIES: iron-containing redox enzyme family protein [Pseudomonas]MBT2339893.1 iron-containing redox enzyme family protein [Pseudomonas fluorescens]MCD4530408.1 iron-containing redox enzyme family protein [Pseudomonas sp. C3-2018]